MKKPIAALLALVLTAAPAFSVQLPVHAVAQPEQGTVTTALNPVADTRLKPGYGNSGLDYSMDTYFTTKNERTSLMKFDVSSIPADATITAAKLTIYCTGSSERQSIVDIRRVTVPWVEGTGDYRCAGTDGATWTTRTVSDLWNEPGGDMDTRIEATATIVPKAWNEWDVTGLVQKWASGSAENNGLAVVESPSAIHAYSYFSTKDSGNKPVLEITYQGEAVSTNTADFSGSALNGTAPLAVTFTEATSPQATAWQWDFNSDGTVDSTAQNPSFTYDAAGTYGVTLKATFPDGTEKTVVKEQYITVQAPVQATADFMASVTSGTAPLSVQFTESTSPQATGWQWDFNNDGIVDSTAQNPSFTYGDAGTYSVALKATFPDGAVKSVTKENRIVVQAPAQQTVTVALKPQADTRLKPNYGNSGLDYSMDTYFTTKNERTSLVKFDLSAIPSNAVISAAKLKIYCTGSSQAKSVVDIRRVTAPWVEGTGDYRCIGTNGATWTTTDGNALWNTPGGDMDTTVEASTVIVPKAWNVWDVTGLVQKWTSGAQANNGMAVIESPSAIHAYSYFSTKDSSNKPVLEITYQGSAAPVNTADFNSSVTNGTAPLAVQFTEATSPQGTAWQWDFNSDGTIDSTLQNPSFSYGTAGTYTVTLKATFPDGTVKTVRKDNLITVAPATTGRIFEVGVGKPYTRIIDVDTANLMPGDIVYIHAKPDNSPYKEKFFVRGKGTQDNPIRIVGVPNAAGQLPIIDGNGAITKRGNAYWNEDRAVIMFGQAKNGVVPEYASIENLKITGAKAQNPYTSQTGGQWMFNWNAAGIWIAAGDNVKLVNCDIYGNENGIFSSSCKQITIDSCYVHDNGMQSGSSQEHNFYLNGGPGSKVIVENCRIGEELNDGQQFKSRAETLIFRYNWIEGGKNSQMDLVEEADNGVSNAWVYGNVIIKPEVTNNGRIIHFGGDNASVSRTGTLYFFNNTVINKAKRSVNIFQINETGAAVVAGNNIFYTPGSYGMNLCDTYYMKGTISGSNNWATDTITGLEKLTDTIKGKTPQFVDFAAGNLQLAAGSPAIDKGLAALPAGIQLDRQYVKHQQSEQRPVNGPLDIGAYEWVTP